jgi:glycosyltransferase involved in cell wall biosynthesis
MIIKNGKKKLKIAIIAHSLFPIAEPYAGGLEKFTHILVKELVNQGHTVDLYAHKDSDPELNLIPFPGLRYRIEGNPEQNKHHQEEAFPDEKYIAQTELYSKIMSDICESVDYDIIHNNSLNDTVMIHGNTCGIPFLTTLHTPPFPSLQNGAAAIKPNCNVRFASVSDSLAETWSSFVDEHTTVYNGIDISKWVYSPKPEEDTTLWYGRICKEKAPHHAILAAKMAGKKLRIAGPISDQWYFDNYIAPHLGDYLIEYVGHKSQKELSSEIGRAECVFFTSVWDEPFGFVLAESLACGTPVIGYKSGAAPEIITSETGILVDTGDIIALAEVAQSVGSIKRITCRNHAKENFSISAMVNNYTNLYNDMIEDKNNSDYHNTTDREALAV